MVKQSTMKQWMLGTAFALAMTLEFFLYEWNRVRPQETMPRESYEKWLRYQKELQEQDKRP